jgi:long-subunit fatty acid transport protein
MGGSFIAIADDATASEANPAGLTILTRPEVAVHGKRATFNVPVDDIEAAAIVDYIDAIRDIVRHDFPDVPDFVPPSTRAKLDDTVTSASFASFVKPMNRWVLSLYYNESINLGGHSDFRVDDTFFTDFWRSSIRSDTTLRSLGVSAAFKIKDFAALGVSVRRSQLKLDTFRVQRVDDFNDIELVTGNLNHTDFIEAQQSFEGDDTDITYNVGLLFNPNGKLSAGLVYKKGGEYDVALDSSLVECVDVHIQGLNLTCDPVARTGDGYSREDSRTLQSIRFPDVTGLGLAWRPIERLTLAVDANRITYSDLSPRIEPGTGTGTIEKIDDKTDYHVGLEYTLLAGSDQTPVSLRAGYYSDPDHDIFSRIDSKQSHFTAGIGAVLHHNFQVDLAGDFSDTVDTAVLSLVYRF